MSFQRAKINDFWREVTVGESPAPDVSPCWIFAGSNAYSGYRAFRCVLAQRAASVIYTGEIPTHVRQRCKNRCCVNVAHLNITTTVTAKPKFSPFTGKPVVPRQHRNFDLIKKVLEARPEQGRYNTLVIAKQVGTTVDIVKKILRDAPLYDLQTEWLACSGNVQMEPISKETKVPVCSNSSVRMT